MKKEEFIALGISEDLASKAEKASLAELAGYAAKEQLEAADAAKASLEKDLKARDKQLEELKKASGDHEALSRQIAALQDENKAAKEKYETDMQELKLTTAIKMAVGDSAHDADLVAGLFDKSKLVLSDDGKVAGLEEQMKAIKKDKAFLFKEEKTGVAFRGGKPAEGSGSIPTDKKVSEMTYSEMAAYQAANPGAKLE